MELGLSGTELPRVDGPLPGPASRALVDVLARHECPAVTARRARRAEAMGAADDDPVVWEEAAGAVVRDADGNLLLDMTAGFGVALVGHRHPEVVEAARRQSERLPHAMGDAFPDRTRVALLERLAAWCPPGLDSMILGLSGADAVEAAVKTAMVATGRPEVLTFEASYHGLSVGTVPLQGYRPAFAEPFAPALNPGVHRLPWGCPPEQVSGLLAERPVGLVLLEPIQGRGGVRPPPGGWLAAVAREARAGGGLLALDEILTGLGRTGAPWAGPDHGVVPDLLCTGKALGGGFPISACVGTREVMDAWGASRGEAIHTQTFLGHPVGCAAALAVLDLLDRDGIPDRALDLGRDLASRVEGLGLEVRGRGLLLGVVVERSLEVTRALLRRGVIALPAGSRGEVIALTPPATLTPAQVEYFAEALEASLAEVSP